VLTVWSPAYFYLGHVVRFSLMVRSLFGQFLWHWILTVGVPIGPQSLVWSLAVGLGFEAAAVAPFVELA